MSGHLRLISPWVRNAVTPDMRRAIVDTIPDGVIVYIIGADSPAGPFYAQLANDDRKYWGGTPEAAVRVALRSYEPPVPLTVEVDAEGYITRIEEVAS